MAGVCDGSDAHRVVPVDASLAEHSSTSNTYQGDPTIIEIFAGPQEEEYAAGTADRLMSRPDELKGQCNSNEN